MLVIWLIIALVLIAAVVARYAEDRLDNTTVHDQQDEKPPDTGSDNLLQAA